MCVVKKIGEIQKEEISLDQNLQISIKNDTKHLTVINISY